MHDLVIDATIEASNRLLHAPNILQFPRDVLFRVRRVVPEVKRDRSLCVALDARPPVL